MRYLFFCRIFLEEFILDSWKYNTIEIVVNIQISISITLFLNLLKWNHPFWFSARSNILCLLISIIGRVARTASEAKVGGQHCPCPVLPEKRARCLFAVRILSRFCPEFKKTVRCLFVRPDKDEIELSGLSLSLSADVWSEGRRDGVICYII